MLENMDFINQESDRLEEKLKELRISASADQSNVVITADGTGEILDIEISPELIQGKDKEAIEDCVLIAMNDLQAKISDVQEKEGKDLLSNLFPGM
ncbi:MAG: YbaB/EbfC family nucleoid-associated protein [Bacteroidetes bacterium]|jgi:DNA-binding YbaB/EbfC family protein|nr:YbaB/EbfC family nucleoid-associated protein [Bacteroidota bacterium]